MRAEGWGEGWGLSCEPVVAEGWGLRVRGG